MLARIACKGQVLAAYAGDVSTISSTGEAPSSKASIPGDIAIQLAGA